MASGSAGKMAAVFQSHDSGHTPVDKLTKTYRRHTMILDIHVIVN